MNKQEIIKTIKKNLPVIRGASLMLIKYTGYKPLALDKVIKELENIK